MKRTVTISPGDRAERPVKARRFGFSSLLAKLGSRSSFGVGQQWAGTTRRRWEPEAARIMPPLKPARPTRAIVASFRLTPQERERVDEAAAVLGLGVSGYARRAVLAAAARDGSGVVTSRAAQARLLALWTAQIGLVAEEVRALGRHDASRSIGPAAIQDLSNRIYACHQAVLSTVDRRRA